MFRNYIEVLSVLIDNAAIDITPEEEQKVCEAIEGEIRAEVHMFYDAARPGEPSAIKLWSVNPTLGTLLKQGPDAILNRRVEDVPKVTAKEPTKEPSSHSWNIAAGPSAADIPVVEGNTTLRAAHEATATVPPSTVRHSLGSQASLINADRPSSDYSPPDSPEGRPDTVAHVGYVHDPPQSPQDITPHNDGESDSEAAAYPLPEPSQIRFRWIHIPANNMLWAENTILAVEKEREAARLKRAQKGDVSTSPALLTKVISDAKASKHISNPSDVLANPLTNPAASLLLKAKRALQRQPENASTHVLSEAVQDPAKAASLLKASQEGVQDPRNTSRLADASLTVEDLREQASMLETSQALEQNDQSLPVTAFAILNQTVVNERKKPRLSYSLLNDRVWDLKQFLPHGKPHGGYMEPHFQMFLPKDIEDTTGDSDGLSSPIDTAQLCIYVSLLTSYPNKQY